MPTFLRNISFAVITAATCLGGQAREASDFFIEAPSEVIPLLTKSARMDMLDYFRSSLDTPTSNSLRGRSRITAMTPSSMDISISDNTTLQLVVQPTGRADTLIMVIETVRTPIADSGIRIYDRAWREVSTKLPDYMDFVAKDKRKAAKKLPAPPMVFTQIEYLPESGVYVFTDRSREYYYKDEVPEVVSYFAPEIRKKFWRYQFVDSK